MIITTKSNNGIDQNGKYINACFWISIIDSLKRLGIDKLSVCDIRSVAKYSGGNYEMMNFDNYKHKEEVDQLLNYFHISLALFVVKNNNKPFNSNTRYKLSNGMNISHVSILGHSYNTFILPILYYENVHFESIQNFPIKLGIYHKNSRNQSHYHSLPDVKGGVEK